jgi:Tfp pilus assembly protein PilF
MPTRFSGLRLATACIALLAIALIPYLQTAKHDFVNYDDPLYVTENRMVQQGLTWDGVKYAFTTFDGGNWHPLTWLSHMLDCTMFRTSSPAPAPGSSQATPLPTQWAGGHHLVNVFLHAANSLLVFLVLLLLTGAFWRSALVAAMFAAHPLHVESVAWVAERKDVFSSIFGLLAIACYVRFTRRRSLIAYAGVVVCFALSLLAKPMLVTLPFVLILFDFWPLKRLAFARANNTIPVSPGVTANLSLSSSIVEKLPLLAMSIASAVLAVISQHAARTVSSTELLPPAARIANALVAYCTYLQKLFVPTGLAPFYPHPGSYPTFTVIACAMLLAAISTLAVVLLRRRPWLVVGWLLFLGMLVPVIGLVQVGLQSMADRYSYLPSIGIFIMVVWSIPWPQPRSQAAAFATEFSFDFSRLRPFILLLCIAAVIALEAASFTQVGYWKDSKTLFTHTLAVSDRNFLAHQNLGNVLEREGNLDAAMDHYMKAVQTRPNYPRIYENIANIYLRKGMLDKAEAVIHQAERQDPYSATTQNTIGIIHLSRNEFELAESAFERAVSLDPSNMEIRGNHGAALMGMKRWQAAISELSAVKAAYPQRLGVRTNLARALAGNGQPGEALEEVRSILEINPHFEPARQLQAQISPPISAQ